MNKRLGLILLAVLTSTAWGVLTKPNGATDVSVYFFVTDPNGDPNTSIAEEDLDIYYIEQGAAIAAKVDMTALANASAAHSDNKGYDCGQGILRVDFPDEAFNGGIGKTVELIVRDVTGATDDGQKDKIFPITVQLGVVADVRSLKGATTGVDNAEIVLVTDFATNYSTTLDKWNVDAAGVWANATRTLSAATNITSTGAAVPIDPNGLVTASANDLSAAVGIADTDDIGTEVAAQLDDKISDEEVAQLSSIAAILSYAEEIATKVRRLRR